MRRTSLLVAATLMLAAFVPASMASATTTRISAAGIETCDDANPIDPGTAWVDEDGVLQVRGLTLACLAEGSEGETEFLAGDEVVVVNFNQDLATGEGTLWGTWTSYLDFYGGEAGFAGTWNGHWDSSAPSGWLGKAVGKGFGELGGWQARFDLRTEADSTGGYVFDPGS